MKIGEENPLLGLALDFHPLDNAHAERTNKAPSQKCEGALLLLRFRIWSRRADPGIYITYSSTKRNL